MKFDINALKKRTEETIEGVLAHRASSRDAARETLTKADSMTPAEIERWEAWAAGILTNTRAGIIPTADFLAQDRPATLDDKVGSTWALRDMKRTASKKVDTTTIPGRLQRFRQFLDMCSSDEISTNELKTHGFHNLESLFNPASYN